MTAAEAREESNRNLLAKFKVNYPEMLAQCRQFIDKSVCDGETKVSIPACSVGISHSIDALLPAIVNRVIKPPLEAEGYSVSISGHCVTIAWGDTGAILVGGSGSSVAGREPAADA